MLVLVLGEEALQSLSITLLTGLARHRERAAARAWGGGRVRASPSLGPAPPAGLHPVCDPTLLSKQYDTTYYILVM
jgi:hypothetical protein